MTLENSGTMSIGGTTTNRSINLELGRSATATSSLGETDLRTLAGVASGAIGMDDFYGASSAFFTTTLTRGSYQPAAQVKYFGYYNSQAGSVSPSVSMPTAFGSTSNSRYISYFALVGGYSVNQHYVGFFAGSSSFESPSNTVGNAGFTSMILGNNTYNRTDATYQDLFNNGNLRLWKWDVTSANTTEINTYAASSSNPFGDSDGDTTTWSLVE